MKLLNLLKNIVSRLGGVESRVGNLETDYIVEQGTSGYWTYRKWNSGIAECWSRMSKACNYGYNSFSFNIPSGLFNSSSSMVATATGSTIGSVGGYIAYANPASTTSVDIYLFSGVNDVTGLVCVEVKGRWK